ncbi:MAG: DUF3604 domain-containing protein, partial [Hyphomonadaceae bacterium]
MFKYQTSAIAAVLLLVGCGGSSTPDVPADTVTVETPSMPAAAPETAATRRAFFGDLHVHTANSFDAYIFNVRASPDDAYHFAKGEAIQHGAGYDIQLAGPPLDFLAVTDHGEYLGVVPAMNDPDQALSQTQTARDIFGGESEDPRVSFLQVGYTVVSGEEIEEIYDRELIDTVWADTIAAAERHNQPGTFTAFSGYEFTSMRLVNAQNGANLHRNVIFRGDAPARLFTTLDSTNPEDLWAWMDTERADGRDVLAIPHNSNASNGQMFALATYEG